MGIVVEYIVPTWQQRLRLEATTISSTQIVGRQLPSQVRVTVNGQEAQDVYVTVIRVTNTGKRPITTEMFAPGSSLRLIVGQACRVVERRAVSARPTDVLERVGLSATPGGLTVAPLLLNPRDEAFVQVLTSNCQPRLTATAAIAGISQVSQQGRPEAGRPWSGSSCWAS